MLNHHHINTSLPKQHFFYEVTEEHGRKREREEKRTHIHTPNYYRVIKHCRSYSLTFREEVWRAGTQCFIEMEESYPGTHEK
jgi:hypothetical protein